MFSAMFFSVLFTLFTLVPVYSSDIDEPIEHSREYHLFSDDDDPSADWERVVDHWSIQARMRREATDGPSVEEIEKFIRTHKQEFTEVTKILKGLANGTAVLSGRLKSVASIAEKFTRKGAGYGFANITDVMGFRYTSQTVNTSVDLVSAIEKGKGFQVIEKKCYGMCPDSVMKYRVSGYRRIHMLLRMTKGEKTFELQIGTPYTNMWSDWDHDIVYKGPKTVSNNADVKTYGLQMADYFWQLDEVRRNLPTCPSQLRNANVLDILKAGSVPAAANTAFAHMGSPPTACFWWNDMKLYIVEAEAKKKEDKKEDAVSAAFSVAGAHFHSGVQMIIMVTAMFLAGLF